MAKKPRKKAANGAAPVADIATLAGGGETGDGLPDEGTVQFFIGQFAKLNDEKRDVNKKAGALRKRAKNQGIMIAVFNGVLKEIDERDGDAAFKRMRHRLSYSKAARLPIAKQMQLIEDVTDVKVTRENQKKIALADGVALGRMGKDPDDQAYPLTTELGQAHMEGWHIGQKELAVNLMHAKEQDKEEAKKPKGKKKAKLTEDEAAKIANQAIANATKSQRQSREKAAKGA